MQRWPSQRGQWLSQIHVMTKSQWYMVKSFSLDRWNMTHIRSLPTSIWFFIFEGSPIQLVDACKLFIGRIYMSLHMCLISTLMPRSLPHIYCSSLLPLLLNRNFPIFSHFCLIFACVSTFYVFFFSAFISPFPFSSSYSQVISHPSSWTLWFLLRMI